MVNKVLHIVKGIQGFSIYLKLSIPITFTQPENIIIAKKGSFVHNTTKINTLRRIIEIKVPSLQLIVHTSHFASKNLFIEEYYYAKQVIDLLQSI